jgi:hypothetical protein
VEHPLLSSADAVPVHSLIFAHAAKVAFAPKNVIGIPETTDEAPPL